MTYSADALEALASTVSGPVLARGAAEFAAEVAAQNTTVQHDPEVVVGAAAEADVVAAIRFAVANSLPVRVLATGHGSSSPVTDGVLITTSRLTELSIDPDSRIATIGAGHHWSEVVSAAAEHGLAPITGASGHVGVIGYLLGGGLGPLARTFGFSSDWVRGFRVVLADGRVVSANSVEHPELFWGLRGGKGGFGVVTSVQVELVPLTSFYGGSVFFDAEHIDSVFPVWVEWTKTVPELATSSAAILRLPPLEVIPEPLRGKTVLSIRFAFVGNPDEGARVFQPIRDAAPILVDVLAEMPAAQVSLIHNDPVEPGPAWDRGTMLTQIDAEFASTLLASVGGSAQVPFVLVELRHLGGATRRDVPGGSAVGGRSADYGIIFIGVPDPSLFGTVLPGVADGILASLAPWASPEINVNYAGGFAVPGSYQASWPAETFARLAEVRAQYDPNGVFPYGPAEG
jgi:FAD/FMN-containing dehydrogenase